MAELNVIENAPGPDSASTNQREEATGPDSTNQGEGRQGLRFVPGIKPPASLNLSVNASENWKLWKQQWGNYMIVSRLNTEPADYQTALFLNCIGIDALKLYNGFVFESNEEKTVVNVIVKFDQHIIGKLNETYERYVFNSRAQSATETFDAYVTALRNLSKNCNFCECLANTLLRDRIVMGVSDDDIRRKMLEIQDLTLDRCIDMCRAQEATSARMKMMMSKGATEEIHGIKKVPKKKNDKHSSKPTQAINCRFCGGTHQRKKEQCPAWGQKCNHCNGRNHFARVCKKKKEKISAVNCDSDSDTGSEYECINMVISNRITTTSLIYAEMLIKGEPEPIKFQVDSGASVNVIPRRYVEEKSITASTKVLQMWNETKKQPCGESRIRMTNPANGKKYAVKFTVIDEDLVPILGSTACQRMGLLTVNQQNIARVMAVQEEDVMTEYSDVFNDDVGSFPGTVHLEIDTTITPVVSPPRRVPVALKARVKTELDRLVEEQVVVPIHEPTDWVSSLAVATKKNGDIRVCIDPRPLNKALRREHYQLTTLDDVLPELSKARIISTMDLKAGYWHAKLDEPSSRLTTFSTPFGRYRWLRLPFGLNVSSEIFAKRLQDCIHDLNGVICVADDLMIYGVGTTDDDAISDHDAKLVKLLQRCREMGIRLNAKKIKLRQTSVPFLGHVITQDGIKPDPAKVEAVLEMPSPTDVEGVQRLNGFVNYLAKFLPGLSDVMEPIRQLTRREVPWNWSKAQEEALNTVKQLMANAPVLRYFDPDTELTVQCDSSQTGLGAALLQEGQPLAFISRALTDTETRYAQIEKEMLAIVWSVEKFNQYTFGRRVSVISDHKPLESIIKKTLAKAPKRLQGMLMRLQKYDVEVTYTPGKKMYLADTLSRAYRPTTEGEHKDFEQVNATQYVAVTDSRLAEIKTATEADQTLTAVKQVILQGWPDDSTYLSPLIKPYFAFRDELAIHDGIVFRGERVVVPTSQRSIVKERLHSSHLGVDGCLRRARESLFWPNMTQDIKDYISTCDMCRKYEVANTKETLMSHEVPDRPWAKVGTDLFSLHGREYLITVDYFSNFWEVDHLTTTESKMVINKLKNHFARYGVPDTIVSDNGPQFNCYEFQSFCKSWDIVHVTSSPYNSKANGKAESAVKTAKRIMRKSKEGKTDPYLAFLDHRNTPSQGLLSSPSQRLMSRRTKTLLPTKATLLKPEVVDTKHTRRDMKHNQSKQALYFNKRAKDLTVLQEGDTVRLQPFKLGDKSWQQGTVTKRLDERSYEVETPTGTVRRNRVHLKPATTSTTVTPETDSAICESAGEGVTTAVNVNDTTAAPTEVTTVVQSPDKPESTSASVTNATPTVRTTRSGRIVKTPVRYQN